MWENMAVAAIRQIILTKTYKRKYARQFCVRQLRLLRHFVRNSLNLWALQLYQVSQLSHEIFVVCQLISGQDNKIKARIAPCLDF